MNTVNSPSTLDDILALDDARVANMKRQALDARVRGFGKVLHCYAPPFPGTRYEIDTYRIQDRQAFTSISITGHDCALQCDHCKGTLLHGMVPASGTAFEKTLRQLVKSGSKGVLVSGGADARGRVPFTDDHFRAITEMKREHGTVFAVHTGLTDARTLGKMKRAGIDAVMFDVIGARDTIDRVCHLDASPADYVQMVRSCKEIGLHVAPHVVIGLDWGAIKGEGNALSSLMEAGPDVLVLVVLMGVMGTPMASIVPRISEVERVLLLARISLPKTPVALGCAKPVGAFKERVERFAVECGFNAIAYPVQETVNRAIELGLIPVFHEHCCSLPTGQEQGP